MQGQSGYRAPLELAPATSYERALNHRLESPIHRENARVIAVEGQLFYSPNSSTILRHIPEYSSTVVRSALRDNIQEFHKPHWWTPKMPFLPFIPLFPNFHCPPFHVLLNEPNRLIRRRKRIVQMDGQDVLRWNHLEHDLKAILNGFQGSYSIPQMTPIVLTSLACQAEFEYPQQYHSAETRCRNWFGMWMGMLSLGIAVAEMSADIITSSESLPPWYKTIVRHFDEGLVSSLRQCLGQFDLHFARAGVLLDITDPFLQVKVDFFIALNVPVWYPWGKKEESYLKINAQFGRYHPPSHLLQKAQTYLVATPAPAVSSPPITEPTTVNQRPWELFFARREERVASRGSPGTSHRKQPMKVFHWERNDAGEWVRQAVRKSDRHTTLAEYGAAQKRFEPTTNEWDCCTEMGEMDAAELQAAADEDYAEDWHLNVGTSPGRNAVQNSNVYNEPDNTNPVPSTSQTTALPTVYNDPMPVADEDRHVYDVYSPASIMHLMFGFVAPLPPSRLTFDDPSEAQIKELAYLIGYPVEAPLQQYAQTPEGRAAANFVWGLCQNPRIPPPNDMYDLAIGLHAPSLGTRRLRCLRKLPGGLYMFDFGRLEPQGWKLGLTNIIDVFFVARLAQDNDSYGIAWELLARGISFMTLMEVPRFEPISAAPLLPRIRLSTYQFGAVDYASYCRERDELLRNPRVARQALMAGGILWRIVHERVSNELVYSGPTTTATLGRQCVSFVAPNQSFWVDDYLDQSEIDILCGVYRVYTGQGEQMSLKSWWPSPALWKSIVHHSFWTVRSETLYEARRIDMEAGKAVPLTSTNWRSRIKSNSSVRRAMQNTVAASESYLHTVR